ncbi:MAG: alpha/beta fold hydrolase [Candidatus Nanopelagicales bacterium]|nr:alpha/beta fold hydrolase [Candidatus Nanopelagicales bacterium]
MKGLFFDDELLDAQTIRAAAAAPFGGADIGECRAAARGVKGTSLDDWYTSWATAAQRARRLGDSELVEGRRTSARDAYLRSCTYDRTAGLMLMGVPADARLVDSARRQADAFRQAAALMTTPVERITIPYAGHELAGYFIRPDESSIPRRTAILLNGYDGTAEELYFLNGAAALARGYNVLAFDGPGQGSSLLELGLALRPDYEAVITPAVDWLLTREDVDPDAIVLIGLSLGGYLAPRAASAEHRLAACIADSGSFDLFASAVARIPEPLRTGLDAPESKRGRMLASLLARVAARPTGGWSLRRGMQAHGVATPVEYLQALREYTLDGHAQQITCPTLVCQPEGDDIAALAPQLAAALTCRHALFTFASSEGAGDHCEMGARSLYHARSFAWLDSVLLES